MKYLVFTQDEYLNNYFIGIFKELKNAIPEINKWLSNYEVSINELNDRANTFDRCFDTEIQVDEVNYVFVRGFILDDKDLMCLD